MMNTGKTVTSLMTIIALTLLMGCKPKQEQQTVDVGATTTPDYSQYDYGDATPDYSQDTYDPNTATDDENVVLDAPCSKPGFITNPNTGEQVWCDPEDPRTLLGLPAEKTPAQKAKELLELGQQSGLFDSFRGLFGGGQ